MNDAEIKQYIDSSYDPSTLEESHPAYFASLQPKWKYLTISSNLIKLLNNQESTVESMKEWFNNEVSDWNKTFGVEKNRWLNLEKEYLENPGELPILLIQGDDGYYYLQDGHHRFAIALKHDILFIPSIVALIE